MKLRGSRLSLLGVALVAGNLLTAAPALAQTVPWDLFEDNLSNSVCGVVNAENLELVVLRETGELVVVSGSDFIINDSLVDLNGDVFVNGEQVGFVAFAEDGDGFRTLWWLSFSGRAITLDGITLVPSESDVFPDEIGNVPCDPCVLWDDPADCPAVVTGIVTPPEDTGVCLGDRADLIAEIQEGTDFGGIRWRKNGALIAGANDVVLTIRSADLFDTATYTIEVLNENGDVVDSANATVLAQECDDPTPSPGLNLCGNGLAMLLPMSMLGLLGLRFTTRRR